MSLPSVDRARAMFLHSGHDRRRRMVGGLLLFSHVAATGLPCLDAADLFEVRHAVIVHGDHAHPRPGLLAPSAKTAPGFTFSGHVAFESSAQFRPSVSSLLRSALTSSSISDMLDRDERGCRPYPSGTP